MSPPSSVTAFPFASTREPARLDGIVHVALEAADLQRASAFYCDVLGFVAEPAVQIPRCGEHAVVRTIAGGRVALCRSDATKPPDMGRHTAFAASPSGRAAILQRLTERGVAVHAYEEDRPSERGDNCYFYDPDGNRIQLVTGADGALDHAGIQAIDIEWAEDLYVGFLGLPVDAVVGWRTEDYQRAARWGEGKEDMAPGTRRWDKRFAMRPGQGPMIARPNMQLFVRTGAATLGVFLAYERYQLPPEEQIAGTPRIGFRVAATEFATLAERFAQAKIAVDGPHEHPPASPYRAALYARDRSGNFLEFCEER
ncbi:MAG TPA: VOC family protein [Candidatus Lustribacter sp.]|jgi:catechol 2,3-dioxygenase-like lactoylglutathione lyase family enzyme|nr:VOC family protein [Candidatus Lustribacter sp.]